MSMQYPVEQFTALERLNICRHAFIRRIAGIDVAHDKAEALRRLDDAHREIRTAVGFGDWPLVTAEQVHGDKIAVIDSPVQSDKDFGGCDGLITSQRGI